LAIENENRTIKLKIQQAFELYEQLNSDRFSIIQKLLVYIPDLQGTQVDFQSKIEYIETPRDVQDPVDPVDLVDQNQGDKIDHVEQSDTTQTESVNEISNTEEDDIKS